MSKLGTLLKYRRAAWSRARTPRRLVLYASLVAALFGLGVWAAPDLMVAPSATSVAEFGDRNLVAGWKALEASFWLTAVLSAVLSFRVMELLFRRRDIVVVSLLPLSGNALFFDRLIAASLEALGFALLVAAFFAPIATFHGAGLVALVAATIAVAGLLSTSWITVGVIMWFGAQFGDPKARVIPGDAYGSSGSAFIYGPGAALAASLMVLLLLQLALGEVLKAGEITRAFQLGLGIAGAMSVIALSTAHGIFKTRYHLAAAYFREAETVGYEIDLDYQNSEMARTRFGERRLSRVGALVYRRTVLQMGRRFTLTRYTYGFVVLAFGLAVWGIPAEAMPTWAGAAVVLVLFSLSNPWKKLRDHELGESHSEYLPLSARDEAIGRAMAIVREVVPVSIAVASVGVLTVFPEPVLAAWIERPLVWFLSGFALAGIMAAVASLGLVTAAIAPLAAILLIVIAASLPGWACAGVFAGIALFGHALVLFTPGERPFQARGV